MKYIEKQTPPSSELDYFFAWVKSKKVEFSTLSGGEQWGKLNKKQNHKNNVQNVILEEQGYICAYCNRRIHKGDPFNDEQLKIEHIEPKSIYSDKTFDYYNMVGACHGDQRKTDNEQETLPRSVHCDVKKDKNEIPKGLFPTNSDIETNVVYDIKGIAKSKDHDIDIAINDVLNLNCKKLITGRKNVLLPLEDLETVEEASQFINSYRTKTNGQFEPYAGVIISYLRNFFNL